MFGEHANWFDEKIDLNGILKVRIQIFAFPFNANGALRNSIATRAELISHFNLEAGFRQKVRSVSAALEVS